ncbi:MAG: hypothetical protein ABIR59_08595 [Gemmatimonadales bacterium]
MAKKPTNVSKSSRTASKLSTGSRAKSTFTKASAKRAARRAKTAFADSKLPASWERGGREWSRVLGHFGATKS